MHACFIANGFGGAILLCLGMFTPATIMPILGHDLLQWAVDNSVVQPCLDGVAAAVLGLLLQTAFLVRPVYSTISLVLVHFPLLDMSCLL